MHKFTTYIENHPGIALHIAFSILLFGIMIGIPVEDLNVTTCTISCIIWLIITLWYTGKLIKEYKETQYWIKFHKQYGMPYARISIPIPIYGNYDAHFLLHDAHGNVKDWTSTKEEAIKKHHDTGLYIVRLYD